MSIFENNIKEICSMNQKVAMFIDMDGTIVEYEVYDNNEILNSEGLFNDKNPINIVIEKLKEINKIENIDLYILSLAKKTSIVEEKKSWLKKYVKFIPKENWIIIDKEKGEYNKENRDFIKEYKIEEKLKDYTYSILLDDDHKILKQTRNDLKGKCSVFHISSALV